MGNDQFAQIAANGISGRMHLPEYHNQNKTSRETVHIALDMFVRSSKIAKCRKKQWIGFLLSQTFILSSRAT